MSGGSINLTGFPARSIGRRDLDSTDTARDACAVLATSLTGDLDLNVLFTVLTALTAL
eukprot:CAMPEP_0173180690 /NCGR_PEP_ID=MMETSP1141-20130122/6854_1 /TAXON_ID=483371 /ORGANISM="non described non described, Strain CCMP2298" /LENGTH=57 /DNA_ID=CAMNT_0014103565 /DNA_START=1210 /DNA_END=1380 /DNA_ORIENTATION=+